MHTARKCLIASVSSLLPAFAAAQGEAYYFATAGIDGGPNSCVDVWCGADMLPFTADDVRLPERGNIGGTWGFSWIDSNGDGEVGEEERIFVVIRRGRDDALTFSTRSYPQYGVLAEGEDWVHYHEARNRGPAASELGDPEAEGDDFEHDDRPGLGQRGWGDASNYYWLNNARADQRGWGGSRYYFEHRNGQGLDEIEGFDKFLSFSTNRDDPGTPFDEAGECRDAYVRSLDATTKGLLIPVADVAGLEDGSLDPLFGSYEGDMAAWVRDSLGPKLADPRLGVYLNGSGCARSGLPATHVMVLQIECPIAINSGGECASQATAEAHAAYWGITPMVAGRPETRAVYRASHVLLFNDGLTDRAKGVPRFSLEPEDGIARSLWVQDDFWRADASDIGRYAVRGPWSIADDSSLDHGCRERDKVFLLAMAEDGTFEALLARPLDPAGGAVYAVVEVGTIDLGRGVGANPILDFYQLIFVSGSEVAAFAEFGSLGSSVNLGGAWSPKGLATLPADSRSGPAVEIPIAPPEASELVRLVARVGPDSITLLHASSSEHGPNDYSGLDRYRVLAALPRGVRGKITAVRFGASANTGAAVAVDGFAVLSNLDPDIPPGSFRRGDSNDDGKRDISDAVYMLGHLFLGGPRWPCEEAADINDDGRKDLSDAVHLLRHLFLGSSPPPPPFPGCGPDPGGEVCPGSSCGA
ncbi:MAG: hypothetical protein HY721_23470 [Planctomycetes bacterium]|nr:hypothetical protein [Planctomycetota bacterium]